MKKVLSVLLIFLLFVTPAIADSYSDLIEKATTFSANGDMQKAIASYQLAQRVDPNNEEAFIREAECHINSNDFVEAMRCINSALEINPVSPDAWIMKCNIDIATDDLASLEDDILFAEVCEADLSHIYPAIGMLYYSHGQYKNAVDYFDSSDLASFDDSTKEAFRISLISTGEREKAESLGLIPDTIHDRQLDASFLSGNLSLVKTENAGISFTADDIIEAFSEDEYWEAIGSEREEDYASQIKEHFPELHISIYSLSPTGTSGIITVESTPMTYYLGKLHMPYPSNENSVADEYGNLQYVYSLLLSGASRVFSDEGIVYSNDGRYIALSNISYTLMRSQFIFDPIIIDLSTGEVILTATYGNKPLEDNSGAVTAVCFSEDNQHLYYMLYGKQNEHRTALYRYNLKTKETEMLYSGSDLTYYPRLYESGNSSILILKDAFGDTKNQAIFEMSHIDNEWSSSEHDFTVSPQMWYTDYLSYSSNSGYALLNGKVQKTGDSFAFMLLRPNDGYEGLNRYLAIKKETNTVVEITEEDYAAEIGMGENADAPNLLSIRSPYYSIFDSWMSPDGYYALILASDKIERQLFMLSFNDLSIKPVDGIDANDILLGGLGREYPMTVEWNNDNIIIITSGGINTYRLNDSVE